MTSRLICAISVFVNISHPVPELNHYLFPGKGVTFPELYSNYLLRQHSRTSKDPSPLLLWKLGVRNRLSTVLPSAWQVEDLLRKLPPRVSQSQRGSTQIQTQASPPRSSGQAH